MLIFLKNRNDYSMKLQRVINLFICILILAALNTFDIIDIEWISVVIIPFMMDIIAELSVYIVTKRDEIDEEKE